MKREILDKIYKQKFEYEEEIKLLKKKTDFPKTEMGYADMGNFRGRIKELENNVAFCEELIDIIVKDE